MRRTIGSSGVCAHSVTSPQIVVAASSGVSNPQFVDEKTAEVRTKIAAILENRLNCAYLRHNDPIGIMTKDGNKPGSYLEEVKGEIKTLVACVVAKQSTAKLLLIARCMIKINEFLDSACDSFKDGIRLRRTRSEPLKAVDSGMGESAVYEIDPFYAITNALHIILEKSTDETAMKEKLEGAAVLIEGYTHVNGFESMARFCLSKNFEATLD